MHGISNITFQSKLLLPIPETLKTEAEVSVEKLIISYHTILHREPRYHSRCSERAVCRTTEDSWFVSR
jgi:hypothetical protein